MVNRTTAALVAAAFFGLQSLPQAALAENSMGYQLMSAEQAAALPRGGGLLGMDVGSGQQITDSGMSFELLRVKSVRRNSAGAQAGFQSGDQIIAVDGRVFPSVAAFAAYIGSIQPAHQVMIDYLPVGGGPQQAQRVGVRLGGAGRSSDRQGEPQSTGLSTGAKVAIGVGAVALFGCYELGCFNRLKGKSGGSRQPQLPPAAAQPSQAQPGALQPQQ